MYNPINSLFELNDLPILNKETLHPISGASNCDTYSFKSETLLLLADRPVYTVCQPIAAVFQI